MEKFLSDLLMTASVTGSEGQAADVVLDYAKKNGLASYHSPIGYAAVGDVDAKGGVLLAAHMDEIGLMVSCIMPDGTLRACVVGGIYIPMYFGHSVRVHTKNGVVYGSVSVNREVFRKEQKATDLIIDIGADTAQDAQKWVEVGDIVTFDSDYRELKNDRIAGRALDDKTGVYVVMEALRRAKAAGVRTPAVACATVGEETVKNGAYAAASRFLPKVSIIVDVTYTTDYQHGAVKEEYGKIKLGGGPAIAINPICSRRRIETLRKIAKENKIALQYETSGERTHTDADCIHQTGEGVETLIVSIPMRYMHSSCETVDLHDIEDCITLIVEYLKVCEEEF